MVGGFSGELFHRAIRVRTEHQRLTVTLEKDPRSLC
jgi:hypothetical protein